MPDPKPTPPDIQTPLDMDSINKSIMGSSAPNITADGAIENTPDFQNAAQTAWSRTQYGKSNGAEAGFTVDRSGNISHVDWNRYGDPANPGSTGSLHQVLHPDTLLALHVHPDDADPEPSKQDVEIAKRSGKQIYVQSRDGLFAVDAQGNVRQVEKGTDWMNSSKKKADKTDKNKKVSQQVKTTDVDHHDDGSHSVYHRDKNGNLVASYAVPSLAGLKNSLNKYVGQNNG
jgi:hypothetical protein